MSEAPERIWIDVEGCFGRGKATAVGNAITKARGKSWDTDVEYIRLDAHEAAVAAARKEGVRSVIDDWNLQSAFDARMCCNGQDCGCKGSTVREYLEHLHTEASK